MRFVAVSLIFAVLLGVFAVSTGMNISAEAAVLIDARTGEVLFARRADAKMQPASMTKIMTALLVIETLGINSTVTVPACAAGVEGSSAYLEAGEIFTVSELLYALLLQSANDAAVALAEACGGTDAFVGMMNRKAEELGLYGTHFANPHGLSQNDHYSTASDIASLLCVCMKNSVFAQISGSAGYVIEPNGYHRGRSFVNHNRLIHTCDGVTGGKTGYTRSSGRCLCSYYDKDGLTLCAVTMNAPRDWDDHMTLYRFGESLYSRVTLQADEAYSLHIVGGITDHVDCTLDKTVRIAVKNGARIEKAVLMRRFEYAPVEPGELVGAVVWYADGEILHSEKLYADNKAERKTDNLFIWKK